MAQTSARCLGGKATRFHRFDNRRIREINPVLRTQTSGDVCATRRFRLPCRSGHVGRHAKSMPYKRPGLSEIDLGGTTLNERERVKGVGSAVVLCRNNVRSLPLADASGHRTDHARRCAPGVPPKLRTLRAIENPRWLRHRPDVWVAKPQDFIGSIIAGSERSILYCAHRRLATSVPPADFDCRVDLGT